MKAISWNVNGIRACINKGFIDYLKNESPDIIWLQEVKATQDKVDSQYFDAIESLWYTIYWNAAQRPGYSGTAVFSKIPALNVISGIQGSESTDPIVSEDSEGRVLTLEFDDYFFTTVYTPNAKDDLSRLSLRYDVWDPAYLWHLKHLEKSKPVISCWDFNVAHREIDLARPKPNIGKKWFTQEERERMSDYLDAWFIDTLREIQPETPELYSWWSYMWGARSRNVGWRIDYFLISESLRKKFQDAYIRSEVMGSDHCPVWVEINI